MLLKLLIQFLLGIGVGIYGYLLPSYINLGVFQMSMNHAMAKVHRIIFIITLVEIPYCFVCMSGMQWLMQQSLILLFVRWLIVLVLLAMAMVTFLDARKKHGPVPAEVKPLEAGQVRRLLVYAIFNPFQLSAWAIWGTYFIEKTWFSWTAGSILLFSLGASIGVYVVLRLYAVMGQKLIAYFASHRKQIDYGMALLLLVLGLVQLVRNLAE